MISKESMLNTVSKIMIALLCVSSILTAQKDTLSEKKTLNTVNQLAELRDQLDDYFNDQNFTNAFWGVMVKSLRTGEILYKRNQDKLFTPASNMKLFTCAAALLFLGPNYSYETNLLCNGELLRGTLKGDLVIQGSGDPTISNRFFSGNVTKVFENWADSLKAKGVYEITGDIYGDDTVFDNEELGKGWSLDYESSWFAAPSSALCFNDNIIMIKIDPDEVNFPAKISINPDTRFVTINANIITSAEDSEPNIKISRPRESNIITIVGSIPKGSKTRIEHVSVSNPNMYFLSVLKEIFEEHGIIIRGKVMVLKDSQKSISDDNLIPLYTHNSVQLRLIIKEMNKNSNNIYAEQILKTIGLEENNFGSIKNGVDACKDLFNTMGINLDNMVMADGSGLSKLNLVTPRQIVNLLSFMYKNEVFNDFYESFPIAGVDGTLIDRMKRTIAQNNVHAKPGYNDNVSALSGYLRTVSGEPLVFSIIVNNFLTSPALANYIQDSVCHRLINFSRN
jgi:serine-type D-Ala-D-Ala carboxypeptidase/endopeptidase (penicillin-binding protein 4)